MKPVLLALTLTASFAAPASAFSFQVHLPTLTFPTQPAPDTSKGCATHDVLQPTERCNTATK
ncbi:hypothetical protein [Yoonia sp. BS5-3]|uniref:Uncharacterized protein n=1 Tax=Yoonia phaeophyticola TaxID=3137369 RepID=A0ABZ2V5L7_9RHOB